MLPHIQATTPSQMELGLECRALVLRNWLSHGIWKQCHQARPHTLKNREMPHLGSAPCSAPFCYLFTDKPNQVSFSAQPIKGTNRPHRPSISHSVGKQSCTTTTRQSPTRRQPFFRLWSLSGIRESRQWGPCSFSSPGKQRRGETGQTPQWIQSNLLFDSSYQF